MYPVIGYTDKMSITFLLSFKKNGRVRGKKIKKIYCIFWVFDTQHARKRT